MDKGIENGRQQAAQDVHVGGNGNEGELRWVENLKSMEEIGWMGVGVEELGRPSNGEVVQMLRDGVWR